MTDPLILTGHKPVAQGLQRAVYLHPTDETKLVKVLLSQPETQKRSGFGNWAERTFPSVRYRQVRKEHLEYQRIVRSNPQLDFHPPIGRIYGFVETDLGMGSLSEKVVDETGGLAVTLQALLEDPPLDATFLKLLNTTITRLYDLNIRAGDLKPRNFVFGQRYSAEKLGATECVLIDGFGDIHAIPIRSLSRWTNHIGLDDSCRRMARRGLVWDAKARQFST
ncbi:MAG: YrbL family protein [Pseudomonadota bacterium]